MHLGAPPPAVAQTAPPAAEAEGPDWYVNQGLADRPTLWELQVRISYSQEVMGPGMLAIPAPGAFTGLETSAAMPRDRRALDFAEIDLRYLLRSEITASCAELWSVREQRRALESSQATLHTLVGSVRERYAVGRAAQADVVAGQVEFTRQEEELLLLEERERLLATRLNLLAKQPLDRPVGPMPAPAPFTVPFPRAELLRLYRDRNAYRQTSELLVYYGSRAEETDYLDIRMEALIERATIGVDVQGRLAELYRTALIPQAEQALTASLETYRVGRQEFAVVLRELLRVLEYRRALAAAVGAVAVEKAKLEYALSAELTSEGLKFDTREETADDPGKG